MQSPDVEVCFCFCFCFGASPLFIRMHPLVSRNLPLLRQLDCADRRRRVPKDRHRNDGSSFRTGVSRALRIASNDRLARILHRQHSISSQP